MCFWRQRDWIGCLKIDRVFFSTMQNRCFFLHWKHGDVSAWIITDKAIQNRLTIRFVPEDSFNIPTWFIRNKYVYRNYLYNTKLINFYASLYLHQFCIFDQAYIFCCFIIVCPWKKKKKIYPYFHPSIILNSITEILEFRFVFVV